MPTRRTSAVAQLFLALLAAPALAAPPTTQGTFTDLGPQVTATTIQGSAFVRTADGRTLLYSVVRGEPAHLLAYDPASPAPVLDLPLPDGAGGSWAIAVSSDNFLYLPGTDGHLLRHRPGSSSLEDLGQALPGQKYLCDLTAGPDGQVFGGTYPGARAFRYDPKTTTFTDLAGGPLVDNENYARSVAYHAPSNTLFAGIGAHAHLIAIDLATNTKSALLPDRTAGRESVYALGIVPSPETGDRLLALLATDNRTLVYNLKTKTVERELGQTTVKTAVKSPTSSLLYYSDGLALFSVDLDDPAAEPKRLARCIGANAMAFLAPDRLAVLTRYGQVLTYAPSTNKTASVSLTIPPQPIPIQALAAGPDGRIWSGGFLAGGAGVYDPATNTSRSLRGISQSEAIAHLDGRLYFGVYPHARLYSADPSQPWDSSKNNPRQIFAASLLKNSTTQPAPNSTSIPGQSRPVALCPVPALHTLFIGTVPEYGQLGGHLLSYSPATDALTDHGEVVPRQSVIALAYTHDTLFAGTSVTGGLGAQVREKEARLLAWNPKTHEKLYDLVPVPGASAITALTQGPDGLLWGVAGGTLFTFDPDARRVTSTLKLVDLDYAARNYQVWRDAFLVPHPDGHVYLTLNNKLLRLDPRTKAVTPLRTGAEMLTLGPDNALYFHHATHLWKYVP